MYRKYIVSVRCYVQFVKALSRLLFNKVFKKCRIHTLVLLECIPFEIRVLTFSADLAAIQLFTD